MQCNIDAASLCCRVCGARVSAAHVRRNCGTSPRPGLGDLAAAGLAAVGITKDRVEAIVGPCGCDERQEAMNEFGRTWLGIGADPPADEGSPNGG
jgi:hypothetical protein